MSKVKEGPPPLIPEVPYRQELWHWFTGQGITGTYDLIRAGRLARPVRLQGPDGRAVALFGSDFQKYHELLRRERAAEVQEEAEAAASLAADARNERELATLAPAAKPKASPKQLEALARARAARGKTKAGAKS